MTPFSLLLDRCGLSHREAADFLSVRPDTVKSWSAGRNPAPAGAIAELRALYARIEQAAAEQLRLIADLDRKHGEADIIEMNLAPDNRAARRRGWPCVGAQAAAYGLVIARSSRRFRLTGGGPAAT